LYRCFTSIAPHNPKIDHADLITATRCSLQHTNICWSTRYIKAHQDDTGRELDYWEQLNCEMDGCAKAHWQCHSTRHRLDCHDIQDEPWSVWTAGEKICNHLVSRVRETLTTKRITDYWIGKGRFSAVTLALVDWEAVRMAINGSKLSRRHWVSKQVSGFCGVGKMMQLWKKQQHAHCPRCNHPIEDAAHVLQCRSPSAITCWDRSLSQLLEWMQFHDTDPDLATAVIAHLRAWKTGVQVAWTAGSSLLVDAIAQQTSIGWQTLLEGCPSTKWQDIQARYFVTIGSKLSAKRWTIAWIKKLWDTAWDQWEDRNGAVHRREDTVNQAFFTQQIRHQWTLGIRGLDGPTRSLFRMRMSSLLQQSEDYQRAWLRSVEIGRAEVQEMVAPRQNRRQDDRDPSLRLMRQGMRAWLRGPESS
jgi:hypothetical protein